jgi:hypothetical protein
LAPPLLLYPRPRGFIRSQFYSISRTGKHQNLGQLLLYSGRSYG